MKSLGKSRLRDPQCSYRTSFRKDERHKHVHRHHNRNNTHRYRKYSPHRLRQTQSTVSLKSIHNNRVIKSIKDCDPIKPHDYQPSPYHAFLKPRTRETRVVYTMINKRDVTLRISIFLFLDIPSRKECSIISTFRNIKDLSCSSKSRRRLHQHLHSRCGSIYKRNQL